jgi:nucleotide-binding universal stress UspA family protein
VGVDGSEPAAQALLWGVREAELRRAEVHAVLAWGLLDQHHPDRSHRFDDDYGRPEAMTAIERYIDDAVGSSPSVPVVPHPVNDLPARGLLGLGEDPDSLLVLGARGRGGFTSLLLGSVSQQVLHHATCPVAIIREGIELVGHHPERIVVGVDGSETALRALQWAVDEAKARDAQIDALHTWQVPYAGGYPYAFSVDVMTELEGSARTTLERAIDHVDTTGLQHAVDRIVTSGDAASTILDAAAGADLVVLGSRGLGGFKGLLLGSVTHHVVHHVACPVVVVPALEV